MPHWQSVASNLQLCCNETHSLHVLQKGLSDPTALVNISTCNGVMSVDLVHAPAVLLVCRRTATGGAC
jgi:hypothetical protein